MASPKAKKSGKKPASNPEKDAKELKNVKENKEVKAEKEVKTNTDTKTQPAKAEKKEAVKAVKENKDTKEVKPTKETVAQPATTTTVITSNSVRPMKGFFAKKYNEEESLLNIFKTPKIWGALLGEMIGTMFMIMLFLTLGLEQPIYFVLALTGIYVAVVGLSGAHLNPLVTAGMMATRRTSAIRGVLYMLAQLLGAWVGLIIINAFRLGSETTLELPMMSEVTGETFWSVALVELLGAFVIAFGFARSMRYARKQPISFALTVTASMTLATVLGIIIASSFFGMDHSFIFNPVAALMYQVLPTAADNFGELAKMAGLALAAYVAVPMVGGIIGFYISDIATRLSMGGYFNECDEPCACPVKK